MSRMWSDVCGQTYRLQAYSSAVPWGVHKRKPAVDVSTRTTRLWAVRWASDVTCDTATVASATMAGKARRQRGNVVVMVAMVVVMVPMATAEVAVAMAVGQGSPRPPAALM